VRIHPGSAEAHLGRLDARVGQHRAAQAVHDYTAQIERDPGNALLYVVLAMAHNGLGEFDRSIPDATRAIQLDARLYLGHDARNFLP
jgi:hypothetical protein